MERWPIRIHRLANVEIKEAVAWYLEINDSLADDFTEALDVAIDRIARSPKRWPVYVDEYRHVLLDRFPYVVVYRVKETQVQILAVAHTKRRPGYWTGRVV